MYCPSCKAITQKPTCPKCGNIYLQPEPPHAKNPGVSAILSFFIPGLGQFYNEQIFLGIIFFFLYFALIISTWLLSVCPEDMLLFLIPAGITWLVSLLQAYNRAKWMRQESQQIQNFDGN